MKIGLYYRKTKVCESGYLDLIKNELESHGVEVALFPKTTVVSDVDRLIVLGGDGTVLRASHAIADRDIPIVGVNFGTLGFLTEFEKNQTKELVELVLSENAYNVERTMLEVVLNGRSFHCLNELAIQRIVSAKPHGKQVAKLSVLIDNEYAGEFTADGLLVSTPTGSTAYSLSAGGSIMTPDCKTFMLTPMCAFSLRSRPIAYPDSSTLTFDFSQSSSEMVLHGDGSFIGKAGKHDELIVKKSNRIIKFLTVDPKSFFRHLTQKISY